MKACAVVLLTAFALAADVHATGTEQETRGRPTVLVIGDSLSAAYGIRAEESWVNLLRKRLGPAFKVVNASVSGDTTGGGLARIELGGNDGLRGLPISAIRGNLQAMTEAVIATGAKPILAGMLMPPNLGPRYTRAFQQVFAEVAEATGAALVPFLLDGVAATAEQHLMQADGVHPTAAGQVRMLDNVWDVLAPLVESEPAASPDVRESQ